MKTTTLTKHLLLVGSLIAAFAVSLPADTNTGYRVVTAEEANAILKLDTTVIVLDVRTKEEFDGSKGHLKNARLIPVQELAKRWKELKNVKSCQILVYCCQCPRSKEAAEILVKQGFKRVLKMEGGIDTWTEAKLAVELSANAPKDGKVTTCSVPPARKKK